MRPCDIGLGLRLLATRLRHHVGQPNLAILNDVRGKAVAIRGHRHHKIAPSLRRDLTGRYSGIDLRALLQHCGDDPIGQRRSRKTLYEAHRKEAISGAWPPASTSSPRQHEMEPRC